MGEEKFASLSSGLLARKGGAKPAMRRQNFINPQGDVSEDLGWNDMGDDSSGESVDEPVPVEDYQNGHGDAPVPEVHKQFDRIADDFGSEADGAQDHDPDAVISAKLPAITPEEAKAAEDAVVEPSADSKGVRDDPASLSVPEPAEARERDVSEGLSPVEPDLASVRAPSVRKPKQKKVLARDKAAFTLRLDKDRHLKLRLASAVSNRSAQQIVTEALDRFLETMPEIDNLADKAPGDQQS